MFLLPFCDEKTNPQRGWLSKLWKGTIKLVAGLIFQPMLLFCSYSFYLCFERKGVCLFRFRWKSKWDHYNNGMSSESPKKSWIIASDSNSHPFFRQSFFLLFCLSFLIKARMELNIKTPGGKISPGGHRLSFVFVFPVPRTYLAQMRCLSLACHKKKKMN